jgi:DNA-binding SARP family transcriptional activator
MTSSKTQEASAPARKFRFELLGPAQFTNLETQETVDFVSRKAVCLLTLLALSPGYCLSREKIASFLWDPAPEEQARASLRQCMMRIKAATGEAFASLIDNDRSEVRLLQQVLDCDLWELNDLLKSKTHEQRRALQMARLWRGDILLNAAPKAPIFEAWLQVERSRLKSLLTSWLTECLVEHWNEFGQDTREVAQELLRIESSHELAHQFMMRYFADKGDQAGAMRQFKLLEQALEEQLDSVPSDETVELLVRIKSGEFGARQSTPIAESPRPAAHPTQKGGLPRIIVRPPLTRGTDERVNYLAQGFSDLLVACLGKFKCWVVLVWPSRGFPEDGRIDYRELARATGADYAIDAALDWRQSPGRLHVSLIDCAAEENVWSDVLSAEPLELQELTKSVAGKISSRLAFQINHIAALRFERSPPGNATAYDTWLRGHELSRRWNDESDREALRLFESAIQLDPGLSCAYASMAALYNTRIMVRPSHMDDRAELKRAVELCQKALLLDPQDSRNHVNIGWSRILAGMPERAATHFKLAVDLNPYDSETLISGAQAMAFVGNLQLANEWAARSLELNPLHPDYYVGYFASIKYLAGEYEEAIRLVQSCPDAFPETRVWAAVSHACLGDTFRAGESYRKFLEDVARRWEGPTPPQEDDILRWLGRAVPLLWDEGREKFQQDLTAARRSTNSAMVTGTSG